ncbi:hypothetical protein [Tsukamurella sp. 1534]|uniref:hypothetical protein n=1 Tax=Tsukamurella sp. 1534 TaxID=1151061 RepID=UPI0003186CE3|nr:hypothetical protein [Tsukamurella sp. 1534]
MSTPATQDQPIPSVPDGTPGRDWRAELPAPLPPGAQQPWRKGGPGKRTWVIVITVAACVLMAVAAIVAVSVGTSKTAFVTKGVVVLNPTQFQAGETACTGAEGAASVRKGAKVTFRSGSGEFDATLDEGVLRSGRCQFPFEVTSLSGDPSTTYNVTIDDVQGTPVSGEEITAAGPLIVYVAPRG